MYRKFISSLHANVENDTHTLTSIHQQWSDFIATDTYLTARQNQQFKTLLINTPPSTLKKLLYTLFLAPSHKAMRIEQRTHTQKLLAEIDTYNTSFIEGRLHTYKSLFDGKDDNLKNPLDEDQRRAIVTDDQHNLLVAAAGSGKTSVLTTRIAYLVRRKDAVPAHKIVALAFNKSAASEMRERLKANFGIDVLMSTFHSFGYNILRENKVRVDDIKDADKLIDELFPQLMRSNHRLQQLFVEYMSRYLQDERPETDFKTKEEYYNYMQNQRYLTLSGIQVKSLAERDIANFFFMHNIYFEYEKLVTWVPRHNHKRYHPDFYLPKHDIYLEHWGLDRQWRTAPWMNTEEYNRTRQWKLEQFARNNKMLIETWHYEREEGTLLSNLKTSLLQADPTIQLRPLSYTELVNKVYQPQQDKAREIKQLITTLITHAKSNFITPQQLEQRLNSHNYPKKTRTFGEMACLVYQAYEDYLQKHHYIDFNDMINQAIEQVKRHPEKYTNRYDHILIDEFQDISNQRLELIKCFVNADTNTKLFCVGDDWQSIYKFAGSEVTFFVDFEQFFEQPAISYLKTNYRSIQSIVDTSAQLIAHNRRQRPKEVQANNSIQAPINLFTMSTSTTGRDILTQQIEYASARIHQLLQEGIKPEDIMVISRFSRPLQLLEQHLKTNNIKHDKLRLLTVHRSKGSEAKHVFILNVVSGAFGFPSEIQDDSVLELIKPRHDQQTAFEEERRLFYVALTRSKHHLYIYTQEGVQSIFLKEIAHAFA